jgi:hypothetical protein
MRVRFWFGPVISFAWGTALSANSPAHPADTDAAPFKWRAAMVQSGTFLGIQHGFRLATEPGTRAELRGPFVKDYFRSIKGVRGWKDGDNTFTNYVGHPMMGAVSGWIFLQNDSRGIGREFGRDSGYWTSRMRAMAWSTAYSAVFEFGPVSEASLGNVGKNGKGAGLVDMVITPVMGTGVVVLEDVLDRFVISAVERRTKNRLVILLTRSILNPDRSFANMMRRKNPWHRDRRPGVNALAGTR